MPIYEYQCAECNNVFEVFQKINDDLLSECKFCNGKVDRIISQTSFQLKGGGWYVSDYAKRQASSTTDAPKSNDTEKTTESKAVSEPKSLEKSSGEKV